MIFLLIFVGSVRYARIGLLNAARLLILLAVGFNIVTIFYGLAMKCYYYYYNLSISSDGLYSSTTNPDYVTIYCFSGLSGKIVVNNSFYFSYNGLAFTVPPPLGNEIIFSSAGFAANLFKYSSFYGGGLPLLLPTALPLLSGWISPVGILIEITFSREGYYGFSAACGVTPAGG